MKYLFLAIGLGAALGGCAPRLIVQSPSLTSASPSSPSALPLGQEPFLVIPETDAFAGPAQELGDIRIKDTGLSLVCDYETVVALGTRQARQLGANVLRIYEHQLPGPWSTCHRIRAKALRVADITPYEKEILWQPTRRLRQADFKASVADRPFEAATNTTVRYQYAGQLFKGSVQLTIETVFDCQNSYFKGTRDPAQTLTHEQGHFDISEIYARRLTKAFKEQLANTKELEAKQAVLYHQVMTEAQTMQDKYDSELYADRSKLPAWLATIAQQLAELQPYAEKKVTIKIKI
ncbi:MAG: hypothetical protein EOO62_15015 [Hymenobacter sp.]|nr:MAG: hypothetical protein EOO62_15015 [Hymenobacter sp.]